MAGTVNQATIIGRLGDEPTIRDLPEGGRVASLSIATSETWRDKKTDEKKERTTWHRVSIFSDRLVDLVEKSLHKGSKVYIQGSLQTRKWTDKDNIERYSTEIVVRPYNGTMSLLEPKQSPERPRSAPRRQGNSGPRAA